MKNAYVYTVYTHLSRQCGPSGLNWVPGTLILPSLKSACSLHCKLDAIFYNTMHATINCTCTHSPLLIPNAANGRPKLRMPAWMSGVQINKESTV